MTRHIALGLGLADPGASEDEIVTTALALRQILDGLGSDRPGELDLIAVHPGDPYVTADFTTRAYEDADRFERDVRIWAGLLEIAPMKTA